MGPETEQKKRGKAKHVQKVSHWNAALCPSLVETPRHRLLNFPTAVVSSSLFLPLAFPPPFLPSSSFSFHLLVSLSFLPLRRRSLLPSFVSSFSFCLDSLFEAGCLMLMVGRRPQTRNPLSGLRRSQQIASFLSSFASSLQSSSPSVRRRTQLEISRPLSSRALPFLLPLCPCRPSSELRKKEQRGEVFPSADSSERLDRALRRSSRPSVSRQIGRDGRPSRSSFPGPTKTRGGESVDWTEEKKRKRGTKMCQSGLCPSCLHYPSLLRLLQPRPFLFFSCRQG
mmetsp:Transcript_50115/g.98714  ORF Transcript_50115/g.98714 Transcript_50115/m.98714 type:complete len:283 (+) Transcript_50115:341-1189(+)